MSYHIYHTKGFILGGGSFGEDSRYLRFFTRELGVISAKAQGARKISSKNRHHLQNFSHGTYAFVRGKAGWLLTSAEMEKSFSFTERKDDLSTAAKLCTLISRLSPGEEKNEFFYDDFEKAYGFLSEERLDHNERKSFETLVAMKILSHLGYWNEEGEESAFSERDFTRDVLREIFDNRRKMNLRIHEALGYTHL